MAFRSLFATRTDVCSSAFLARNICVSSFRPIFFNVSGDVAAQWRTELVTWVLGAVAKPIETRVPKLLEKAQCDRPSSVWHWYEQGAIQTSWPTSWQLRNINNVCNVQGTLTCPTPPQPLPTSWHVRNINNACNKWWKAHGRLCGVCQLQCGPPHVCWFLSPRN